jgi:hypothetical protein
MSPRAVAQTSFRVRSVGADWKVLPRIHDFDVDEDGNPIVGIDPGRSCSSWTRLERNELSVRADAEGEIRLRLEPPAAAEGAYWCLLTVEVQPEISPHPRGSLVQIVPRVSVPILVSVGEEGAPRLTVRLEEVERQPGAVSSRVLLENRGTGAVRLTGRLVLEEVGTSGPTEVGSAVMEEILVLPGHRRRTSLRVPARGRGTVRLRGVFDYAPGQAIEVQSPPIP